jgi:hypothetical protein
VHHERPGPEALLDEVAQAVLGVARPGGTHAETGWLVDDEDRVVFVEDREAGGDQSSV